MKQKKKNINFGVLFKGYLMFASLMSIIIFGSYIMVTLVKSNYSIYFFSMAIGLILGQILTNIYNKLKKEYNEKSSKR